MNRNRASVALIGSLLVSACVPAPLHEDTGQPDEAAWWYDAWAPPGDLAVSAPPGDLLRAGSSDGIYWVEPDAERVVHLTRAMVRPEGTWCLDGPGDASECSGMLLSPGEIGVGGVTHACLSETGEQLYAPTASGLVAVIGTTRASQSWQEWHRVYRVLRSDPAIHYTTDGPCAPTPRGLVLSSPDHLVGVHVGAGPDMVLQVETGLTMPVTELFAVGEWLVVRHEDDSASLRRLLSLRDDRSLATGVLAMAADQERQLLWTALESGAVVQFALGPAGALETARVDGLPGVSDLSVDERTGRVHALRCEDVGCELSLLDEDGVLASVSLAPATALVPSGGTGEAAVIFEDGSVMVYTPRSSHEPHPDLSVFLASTLEQPFSDGDMACTAAENPERNWAEHLANLRANAEVLEALGLPLTIGVTWEFWKKSVDCGEGRILDELHEHGFELGYMVHSRPCYSCTDGAVEGEHPASCDRAHQDYASPRSADACWPSDPDYCDPGDSACWLEFVSTRALAVDDALPGGARFIQGADRHSLWDWDWVRGYRDLPRADGSFGYESTLFVANWAYPEVDDIDDPRGKDPSPWEASRVSRTWFGPTLADWDRDSAFSHLLILPGNSIDFSRLAEWQGTGLTVVQLGEEGVHSTPRPDDLEVASALLRHALARRHEEVPSTFYVHVPDLTTWRVSELNQGGHVPEELLSAWAAEVSDLPGVRWALPSQVRADAEDLR